MYEPSPRNFSTAARFWRSCNYGHLAPQVLSPQPAFFALRATRIELILLAQKRDLAKHDVNVMQTLSLYYTSVMSEIYYINTQQIRQDLIGFLKTLESGKEVAVLNRSKVVARLNSQHMNVKRESSIEQLLETVKTIQSVTKTKADALLSQLKGTSWWIGIKTHFPYSPI